MTTIHIPPGTGQHYPMIDGDHVAKAAVHDETLETILSVTERHGVRLAGA